MIYEQICESAKSTIYNDFRIRVDIEQLDNPSLIKKIYEIITTSITMVDGQNFEEIDPRNLMIVDNTVFISGDRMQ